MTIVYKCLMKFVETIPYIVIGIFVEAKILFLHLIGCTRLQLQPHTLPVAYTLVRLIVQVQIFMILKVVSASI